MDNPFSAYQGSEPYVFVSYAHEDCDVVFPEILWLRDQGFNIWYDEGILRREGAQSDDASAGSYGGHQRLNPVNLGMRQAEIERTAS